MGDRILIQVVNGKAFSPVIYGHWSGSRGPEVFKAIRARMEENRPGDVDYTAARVVQILTSTDPDGCLSFGLWNTDHVLTPSESHGDAGILLIDVSSVPFRARCFGGYLHASKSGTSVVAREG